jgi:CDP-diacylglycerol--glycerol-3-phosphate 3-phosphatidyltransferase
MFLVSQNSEETCTHALLSKLWGFNIAMAFVSIIGFSYGRYIYI